MLPKNLLMPFLWLALAFVVVCVSIRVYAEFIPQWPFGNHVWYDMAGKWLTEKDYLANITPPAPKPVPSVREIRTVQLPKETIPFDLDKFAIAVSHAETGGGKKWSAITHNNAFGIMTWDKNGKRSYKRYATLEDSYTDFKRIWRDKYGNKYPTMYAVKKWTGNDRANNWIKIVNSYYYK